MSDDKLVRLSVNLNLPTADALRAVATAECISYTEAVRRAIAVYVFIRDEQTYGRVIRTADADGRNVREIILLGGRPCPTCSGLIRETVNMRCETCGRDFMEDDE